MKLLLRLSFLGTAYCGFQAQPSGDSIQQVLTAAASSLYGRDVAVTGCSRTDSGVHANAYYVTLSLPDGDADGAALSRIPLGRIPMAMNRLLPYDIAVHAAAEVGDDFHPRYSASGKEYVYRIHNGATRDPMLHGRAHFIPVPLDVPLMHRAAQVFTGTHDFRGFMASGSSVTDTVRTLYAFDVRRDGDLVSMTVSGNGFLYNMVRILCGTLIAVSQGQIAADSLPAVLESGVRHNAGATLPACGLILNRVFYPGIDL